jgi:hypothetical protein
MKGAGRFTARACPAIERQEELRMPDTSGEATAMTGPVDWGHCTLVTPEQVADGLRADDPKTRARAVSAVCPCRMERSVFERFLPEVRRMQKDPDERVRKAAAHVLEESLQLLSEGVATTPRLFTNEMEQNRCRNRWRREDAEESRNSARRRRSAR